jgi:acyl-CoA synthetase (AMP-forming)/AMP-acid ligase II
MTDREPGGIAGAAARSPDAVAITDQRGTVSFGELDDRQRALAGLLGSSDIGPGDVIAVLASNRREYLEVTIGALRAGVIPVPVNPLLQPAEISYVLEDSRARFLFTDRTGERPPQVDRTLVFGDEYEDAVAGAERIDISDHVRTRPMHYTSGTTGRPKGVFLPLADDAEARRRSAQFRALWGIVSRDVHLVCSPLGHSAPHRFSMRTLEAGGSVVLQEGFDPAKVLGALDRHSITSTFMVPTHLERILRLDPRELGRRTFSSLRLLAHAGAPISEETKLATFRTFPARAVWEFYGSTEGPATRISAEEWLTKRGSVGRATPGAEILILDDDAKPLPPGEVGQVWVNDPDAERFAYWRDESKTADAWKDGAYSVGDLGWLDGDGYLFLTGRKHDTIISGGVNVYPQEVELVLSEHPAIAEAVVFGVPNDEWGQEVRAQVVLQQGQSVEPDEVIDWLRRRAAHYKCPRRIDIVTELERTATGKLRRPNA